MNTYDNNERPLTTAEIAAECAELTDSGYDIPLEMVDHYLSGLVNQFFKILPLKEDGEPSLNEFMKSLQIELLGFKGLMKEVGNDSMYLTLLSILQYMIENDCDVAVVKREVFKAIKVCKKLRDKYCETGV